MTRTIDDFMETVASKNERTRAHYREALRQIEGWAGCPLGALNENRLATLMQKLRKMPSGQHYAGILRMFLTRFDMDRLAKKAVLRQRLKRLRDDEILTMAEVRTLIDAAGPTRNRAFIAALYDTGVRVSELCALTRADVALKPANGGPAYYVLRFWNVKVRGEEHLGYMITTAPLMEQWLRIHPDPRPEAPLFPSGKGGPITRKGGWAIVASAAKRAKVGKRVHPHTFRHSRATHLLQSGASDSQVKLLMGWSPGSSMLARYAHLRGEDGKGAAFRAAGVEAPEEVKVEVLDFSDERLKATVPVPVFPATPGENPSEVERLRAEVAAMRIAFDEFMVRDRVWQNSEFTARALGTVEKMGPKPKAKG
jgi:integrase